MVSKSDGFTRIFKEKKIIALCSIVFVFIAVLFLQPQANAEEINAVVYKSSSCGCCDVYTKYLQGKGVNVTVEITEDMQSVKDKYNIPYEMNSCHTTIVDGYFIEGHVPVEAMNKLLEEKPKIAGIALPEMPSGSPGMPGAKTGPFVMHSISNGKVLGEFFRV